MAGQVEWLPVAPGTQTDLPVYGSESPIRAVTRSVAFEAAWDLERRNKVRDLFDSMAADWTESRDSPAQAASVVDALTRGAPQAETVVELGAGSGLGTRHVLERYPQTIALDLSMEMLRHSIAAVPKVRADASALPLRSGGVDVFVMVNMLLFPQETDRVLSPSGSLVWINTKAEETPIHLSAEDFVAALPGHWVGVASRAGTGSWCVARRA